MPSGMVQSADSFCMEVNGGPASSTPIKSSARLLQTPSKSVYAQRKNFKSPSLPKTVRQEDKAKSKSDSPAAVEALGSKRTLQHVEESKASNNASATPVAKLTNKRKIFSPKNQLASTKRVRKTLLEQISLPNSSFEGQLKEILENSSSINDSIITRKMYKHRISEHSITDRNEPSTSGNNQKSVETFRLPSNNMIKSKASNKKTIEKNRNCEENIANKHNNVKEMESVVFGDSIVSMSDDLRKLGNSSRFSTKPSFIRRKLYSALSDFTDNDSSKTHDSSFLEKNDVINIYNPTKKLSDLKSTMLQKNILNLPKSVSTVGKSGVYSLRDTNKDMKNYFGDEIPDKSVIYKTATKEDTNRDIMDLLKDIHKDMVRDTSKNSSTGAKDAAVEAENLDESDSMFGRADVDDGASKKSNKKKSIAIPKKQQKQNTSMTNNSIEAKSPIKQRKQIKSSEIKKIVKKKSPVKHQKRQKNNNVAPKVKKIKEKKDIKKASKKRDLSGEETSKKMRVHDSNKDVKKKKIGKAVKNTSFSSNSSSEKTKYQKHDVLDKKHKKRRDIKTISNKNTTKNGDYNRNIEECDGNILQDIDDFTSKFRSKYNCKDIVRTMESTDSSDSESDTDRNACVPYNTKQQFNNYNYGTSIANNNDRRLVPCAKPKIPRFSQSIPYNPFMYNADSENFDTYYHRYFPTTRPENRIVKRQPSIFYNGVSNSSARSVAQPETNYRDMTVSFTNDMCRRTKAPADYDVRLYSKTRITIDNPCDDVFKMPIAATKKRKIIHEKKHAEETHQYTSARDDVSIGSHFSSVSHSKFSSRPQPLKSSSHNKSICSFTKKSCLNTSATSTSSSGKYRSTQNLMRSTKHQTGHTNKQSDDREYRNDYALAKPMLSIVGRENDENRCTAFNHKSNDNFGEPSTYDRDATRSPILKKYNNFNGRTKMVSNSHRDVTESFQSKPVESRQTALSSYKNYLNEQKSSNKNGNDSMHDDFAMDTGDGYFAMDQGDDSWITVKRPTMAPCSPWRYSNSYT